MKKYFFFAVLAAVVVSFIRFYIKTEREIQEILAELEKEETRAREEEEKARLEKEASGECAGECSVECAGCAAPVAEAPAAAKGEEAQVKGSKKEKSPK